MNADGLGPPNGAVCEYKGLTKGANTKLAKQAFREVPADTPYGLGTAGYRLVPNRTVAVDQRDIGKVYFLSALKGQRITTGTGDQSDGSSFIHDGYVFGAEVGDAIKGNHTDLFTGFNHLPPPVCDVKGKPRLRGLHRGGPPD